MKSSVLTLFLVLFAATASQAGVVLSDSFTYPNGDISTAPGSPWMVHSGTTPANIDVNELRLTGGNSVDINALLAGNPYFSNSPAVLYSSFKMRVTSRPGNAGTYFAHFKDTNTVAASGFGGRVWVSASNAYTGMLIADNQVYRVGIGNGTSATAASGQINQDLLLNTTYSIVTRFVPNTGESTIWLEPTAESDPSVTATDSGTAGRPNPIDVVAYAFRQSSGIGVVVVDNLKVGTSFADVGGDNTPPSISGVPAQSVAVGASTPLLAVTVGDVETPAGSLTLTASSSLQSLVPDANIVLGGSDSNRTITVTPVPGLQGVATITVSVTDGGGIAASTSFQLSVGIPTISNIPNQSTPTNTVLADVPFTVADTETAPGSLMVTATSDNQTLVPDGNIVLGGAGVSRTLTLTPTADQAGLALITVTVSDGTSSSTDTFVLVVNPLLGLLRSDNFDRSDGALVTGDGSWISNGGTGGTHIGELQIAGNKIVVSETGSEDVSTDMPLDSNATYAPASGTILYVSMTVALTNLPTPNGSYFSHFKADVFDGLNFRGRVFAATSGAESGKFRLGVANNSANVSAGGLIPADLSLNTPYFIVVRYNVGTGETRLWVNPSAESSAGLSAGDTPSPIAIGALAFRQNSGIGIVCVDDLKIGTAWSDVVSVRPSLQISAIGNYITICWPASATGYVLQGTDELVPLNWMNVNDPIFTEGAKNILTLNNSTGHRFFRLNKP